MGVATVTELKQSISGRRVFRPSLSSGRHANEWPPTDVSSDLTVEVGTSGFALHKFPLVSRSGKIRKLLSEAKDSKVTRINLPGTPGGSHSFELAAKFCYGVNIEITLSNVAMLRCASHYLLMTEDYSEKNLELKTEFFLKETVIPSISNSISVLKSCESLLPSAEEIGLVNRLIASITNNVCKEQLSCGLSKLEQTSLLKPQELISQTTEWWGKSLSILGLEFFQRVLSSVKSKGLKQETVSRILINYSHSSLQGLMVRGDLQSSKVSFSETETIKKQRLIVETIVSLLPAQSRKSPVPMAFLSSLLKTANLVIASNICKGDLEKRIGLQLDQAILEDILIPFNSQNGSNNNNNHHHHQALYDTDTVVRIFTIFLNFDEDEIGEGNNICYDFDSPRSPKQSLILKVSKLMDSYLAEIALDSNLIASKFISLAELLPDHARVVTDGLYRAVDIFLKVHPNIKESERYRLCKTIDCQKLSQEACSHAAQNERLPVQMSVQVLYFEQIRLRNAINGSHDQFFFGLVNSQYPQRSGSGVGSGAISPRDNYASVRRENRELKLEVARMRMRLTDLEKDHVSIKQELVKANPANKLLKSFTKKLSSKLSSLFRISKSEIKPFGARAANDAKLLFQRRRRNSIS